MSTLLMCHIAIMTKCSLNKSDCPDVCPILFPHPTLIITPSSDCTYTLSSNICLLLSSQLPKDIVSGLGCLPAFPPSATWSWITCSHPNLWFRMTLFCDGSPLLWASTHIPSRSQTYTHSILLTSIRIPLWVIWVVSSSWSGWRWRFGCLRHWCQKWCRLVSWLAASSVLHFIGRFSSRYSETACKLVFNLRHMIFLFFFLSQLRQGRIF